MHTKISMMLIVFRFELFIICSAVSFHYLEKSIWFIYFVLSFHSSRILAEHNSQFDYEKRVVSHNAELICLLFCRMHSVWPSENRYISKSKRKKSTMRCESIHQMLQCIQSIWLHLMDCSAFRFRNVQSIMHLLFQFRCICIFNGVVLRSNSVNQWPMTWTWLQFSFLLKFPMHENNSQSNFTTAMPVKISVGLSNINNQSFRQ